MHRTQIYLDDDVFEYLKRESEKSRLSFSEFIRKNIRSNMKSGVREIIAKMEKAAGSWTDQKADPNAYIRKLRKKRTL